MNWPNWQISCSLYVCLCFVWRIGGLGHPGPSWLRHWATTNVWLWNWLQAGSLWVGYSHGFDTLYSV